MLAARLHSALAAAIITFVIIAGITVTIYVAQRDDVRTRRIHAEDGTCVVIEERSTGLEWDETHVELCP